MIDLSVQRYALFALAAAALFGASTPLAKLLLGDLPPLALAGLLDLGSGLGLLVVHVLGRLLAKAAPGESTSYAPSRKPWRIVSTWRLLDAVSRSMRAILANGKA